MTFSPAPYCAVLYICDLQAKTCMQLRAVGSELRRVMYFDSSSVEAPRESSLGVVLARNCLAFFWTADLALHVQYAFVRRQETLSTFATTLARKQAERIYNPRIIRSFVTVH